MRVLKVCLHIFVYIVVVCPLNEVICAHGGTSTIPHGVKKVPSHSPVEPPCSTCPRQGRCVPRVQCPAHVRPGSYNPECHLDKGGRIGICCFTGSGHAAESDHQRRKARASTVNAEDLKSAHHHSRQKLADWVAMGDKLSDHAVVTVLNNTSPSFGHHLSMLTQEPQASILGRGGLLNLFAAQELKSRQAVDDDDLLLGLAAQADGPFCPPVPRCPDIPSRFRPVGGECNNPAFPSWGALHSGFERLLPPDYSDGIWSMRASSTGLPLPPARAVSNALLLDGSHPSDVHNLMMMQFGQFLAHDITSGVVFTIGNGSAISCCADNGEDFAPPDLQHGACAPVALEPEDPFYGPYRQRCFNFVRTQVAPASDCSVGYAKQMNGVTHYADLSQIYGSSDEKVSSLRAPGGLLATFNDYGRELPPLTKRQECLSDREGAACFESGDNHGNQIISLTVLHTVFTREHIRVARALARLNPGWDEDKVFWETRRLVQAEFQHVVFNEWLPLVLGPDLIQIFNLAPSGGYSSSYDPHVSPALTAEFSTSAMRFGHSTVDGKLIVPSSKTGGVYETISIPEVMFQPSRLRLTPFLDRMLTGLSWQPMQAVDPFVTEGLTRYLFHGGNPFGLDLASINIQRGRDWGVRSYNEYRRLIGLQPYSNFGQFSPTTAQRLSSVYASPEDIDLWVGGLLEEPIDGGVVGATFANILADQFSRLKRGDRYFYEYGPDVNPGSFTPSQLSEIKKVTLARIICDNRDGVELISQSPMAFLRPNLPGNEPVLCESPLIPGMDLSRFKEI